MHRLPTSEEDRLWRELRARRFVDYKFRRQFPVGPYIADLVCLSARLFIELDGSQHAGSVSDARRDEWLNSQGFRVLRVWNNELTHSRDSVLEAIWHALEEAPR